MIYGDILRETVWKRSTPSTR